MPQQDDIYAFFVLMSWAVGIAVVILFAFVGFCISVLDALTDVPEFYVNSGGKVGVRSVERKKEI